jgi:hypothetical protein
VTITEITNSVAPERGALRVDVRPKRLGHQARREQQERHDEQQEEVARMRATFTNQSGLAIVPGRP